MRSGIIRDCDRQWLGRRSGRLRSSRCHGVENHHSGQLSHCLRASRCTASATYLDRRPCSRDAPPTDLHARIGRYQHRPRSRGRQSAWTWIEPRVLRGDSCARDGAWSWPLSAGSRAATASSIPGSESRRVFADRHGGATHGKRHRCVLCCRQWRGWPPDYRTICGGRSNGSIAVAIRLRAPRFAIFLLTSGNNLERFIRQRSLSFSTLVPALSSRLAADRWYPAGGVPSRATLLLFVTGISVATAVFS